MLQRFQSRPTVPVYHPIEVGPTARLGYDRGRWITRDEHAKTQYTVHLWSHPSNHPDPTRLQSTLHTTSSKYKLVRFHVGKDMGAVLVRLDEETNRRFKELEEARGTNMTWKAIAAPFYARAVFDYLAVLNTSEDDRALARKLGGTVSVGYINYPRCLHRLINAFKRGFEWDVGADVSQTIPSRIIQQEVVCNAYHLLMPSLVEKELGLKAKQQACARGSIGKESFSSTRAEEKDESERPKKRLRLAEETGGTREDPIDLVEPDQTPLQMVKDKRKGNMVRRGRSSVTAFD